MAEARGDMGSCNKTGSDIRAARRTAQSKGICTSVLLRGDGGHKREDKSMAGKTGFMEDKLQGTLLRTFTFRERRDEKCTFERPSAREGTDATRTG